MEVWGANKGETRVEMTLCAHHTQAIVYTQPKY